MRCYRVGCHRSATHHLGFKAWGLDEARIEKTAIRGVIRQPLCKRHAKEAHPSIIFKPEGWEALTLSLTSRGRPAPTAETVIVYPVEGVPEEPTPDEEPARQ